MRFGRTKKSPEVAGIRQFQTQIEPERLRSFAGFTDLPADDLVMLAQFFDLEHMRPGSILFDIGAQDSRDYLLLEGQIDLVASDGRRIEIPASSPRATQAIARLRPRKFKAEVVLPSLLVSIEHGQLEALMEQIQVNDEIRVFNMQDPQLSQYPFYLNMTADLSARRLRWHYPTDVGKGLKTSAESASDNTLVTLIMADPLLAARAIRCAQLTDPNISGERRAKDVLQALPTDTLRQLVLAQPVADFQHPKIEAAWHRHWEQALELASMVRSLSEKTQIGHPEDLEIRVMWAEMGPLILLAYIDQEPALAQDPAAIEQAIDACGHETTLMFIREWKLGQLTASLATAQPDHPGDHDLASETDLVIFAKMHRRLLEQTDLPSDWRLHPSFSRVSEVLPLSPDFSMELLDQARNRTAGLSRPWSQTAY